MVGHAYQLQSIVQFGQMIQKVDFPKVVGELFQSVFQAIVDSSIERMHAYRALIANVAKTIDQFMADHITGFCFPTLCGPWRTSPLLLHQTHRDTFS